MVDFAEGKEGELQVAMSVIEASLLDSIREHTEHENPIILPPYDNFEVKGDRLTLFDDSEFSEVLDELGDNEPILVYDAEEQACYGLTTLSAFLDQDVQKAIALDENAPHLIGILKSEEPTAIKDHGFWGGFKGDDGTPHFFSRGQFQFFVAWAATG